MIPRWTTRAVLWLALLAVVASDDSPPGLVSKDSEQDLVAEATQNGAQAQKRDASLANSYGEPLPPDAYGPPQEISNIVPDLQLPAPIYGVPDFQIFHQEVPQGAYGPPAPVVFPNQHYDGPPPPIGKPKPKYGPPKIYGPPKMYGPPKPVYGPPKKIYGPPKQVLPKPTYGAPFKPPKISFPKPVYGVPKPIYGPPKPIYGPPKISYGPPLLVQNVQQLPEIPPVTLTQSVGNVVGASIGNIGSNIDFGNLPAPIYGTPLPNLPVDLKPNFPIPADTYGPPGHPIGPIGPNDQIVVQEIENFDHIGHYGPPQPDPNPRPPHPGIPAPPTPPHVLYDGWKPIPGVSKPSIEHENIHTIHNIGQNIHFQNIGQGLESLDQYGPPPPPPVVEEVHVNLDGHGLPNINQHDFGAQITSGYSSVHQDALANIDLNAIVGGDSNHIDQSKTVFEAHYTENTNPQADLAIIQNAIPTAHDRPIDTYVAPPLDSLSGGPYPSSIRQQGAKLLAPSGIYGVPPGSQYGAPPKLAANLPIPYGTFSGGGHSIHTGGNTPRHPIKFRESVPEGLIQQIGQISHHKDTHGADHIKPGPTYLPPPIREIKDINLQTGNHGFNGVSLSIEPSNLYSLPHSGSPLNFQTQPSNLYGSPIDSYSAPLLTVGDHTASGSNTNAVTATVDGTILANLSNLEAAAILKHCPYHEAILKAAKYGEKIPSELASNYVASLSSLGSALSKNQQKLFSPQNSFNTPAAGSESVSYNTKDLSTASHTLVQTVLPSNQIESEKTVKNTIQKGKSLKDESKNQYKQEYQTVSEQIFQTSEKIKNLSEETRQLQQKIAGSSQNINVNTQNSQFSPTGFGQGQATYSVQIQSSDGSGKATTPSIPHEQLLSEGLLQSILQAIEQPSNQNQVEIQTKNQVNQIKTQNNFASSLDFSNIDIGGLVLPAGYEPIDRTKKDQETQGSKNIKHILHDTHKHRGDISHSECDLKADNSITHTIVVPAPNVDNVQPVEDLDDNDVAIYFGEDSKNDKNQEPVTEISVATSISENVEQYAKMPEFGDKVSKKQT
ncbi:uncharacterized protein [Epargyreus clarus]|uniref:uncharacterized protein n=1 Tax=Epargyreus clarus TaxID=520877 RepID=UPI003C2E125D